MNSPNDHAARRAGLRIAPPRWVFFVIFAISGFSGLIYESIWSHYLKLFLGHAAYAQSLVLVIFMGGLALGSWLTARFSDRLRAPILIYAIVEAVVGLIALVFHGTFVSVSETLYRSVLPGLDAPALAGLLKWATAAALILPQSVLLGMTFPLMTGGIIRRYPEQPGGSLALLYFTNSLGAAIGVLVSGFWLIASVGLPGTIMTAGLLNLALALAVVVLVRLDPEPALSPARAVHSAESGSSPDPLAVCFFVAAGITGAASFMYEIGWIRMLSLVLGSTTHSFELMLSAFITGLAFGGLWIKRRIDRIDDPVRFSGWVQMFMGAAALLTLPLYVQTFDWMAALLAGLERNDAGYNLFTMASHLIALVVMVPTTFLAGMTLPLFTHVLMRGRQGERAIGRVYAANTVGAIAGVLFAVHIGLPILGLKWLIVLGALLDIGLGIYLLRRSASASPTWFRLAGATLCGLAVVMVAGFVDLDPRRLASGVYRYSRVELAADETLLFNRHGKTASVSLITNGSEIAILTNGKPDAAIQMDPDGPVSPDQITMVMAGSLPLAYKPDAVEIANVGLGSGLTTHTLLGYEQIEYVDTIEIEPYMVVAAQGFGEQVARAFADPRSRIHVEDAKTFFSLHNVRYDAIVTEPSNPWVSGIASLFSEEFYRHVRNYLKPDGVFVQWLQLYEFNDALALSVLRALSQSFDDFAIYMTDNTNILIVAKPVGTLGEPSFEKVFEIGNVAELERVGLVSGNDFIVRRVGQKQLVDSLLAQAAVPANSDYFPYLDLNAGKARFRSDAATLFPSWATASLPLLEMLNVGRPEFSEVSYAAATQRTVLVDTAHVLLDAIVEDSLPYALEAALGPQMTNLELLRHDCSMASHEMPWLNGLHLVAELVLPYVDAADGERLLDALLTDACSTAVSPRMHAWHELYRTVAARDAARMSVAAERVLEVDPVAADTRRSYALTAGLLGYLADGNKPGALAFWQRHTADGPVFAITPPMRLLLSLASQT